MPGGILGYKYEPSAYKGDCCDKDSPGYLGTKKAKHISSFVEFYQVKIYYRVLESSS